jgi:hypothetical protein
MHVSRSRIRPFLFAVTALAAGAAAAPASVVTAFNANVNEWSSSTPSDMANGIYPIGGSGQINGGFVVTTASNGDQIGLRAFLRGVGLLPQTNDGVLTATYLAPAGTSGMNLSLWNLDGDIDLRASGHTISDYTATLTFTDRSGLVTPVDAVGSGLAPANTRLGQSSENPGFPFLSTIFPSFDPNALGVYSLDLTLVPKTFTGDTLEARINVDVVSVPEPASLALALCGSIGLVCCRGRRTRG